MHLHELLGWSGPMTHRQFAAWQAWLFDDLNRPSRTDHYIMQAAQHAVLPYVKEGQTPPSLKDMVIPFVRKGDEEQKAPVEEEQTDGPPIVTEAMIVQAQKDMAIARFAGAGQYEHRWVNRRGEPIPPPVPKGG